MTSISRASSASLNPVLLRPRPVTHPGVSLVLLPLLPTAAPKPPIPEEIWKRILTFTMKTESDAKTACESQAARLRLICVCKSFKEQVLPMLYCKPYLPSFETFAKFSQRLLDADQKWDNLRRIHYSTPGRWVESLDLTLFSHLTPSEYLKFDKLIAQVFHVVPFLGQLCLHPTVNLTRQAMYSLADSPAAARLRSLRGMLISSDPHASISQAEYVVSALQSCRNLEYLELLGAGFDPEEAVPDLDAIYLPTNFSLPCLQSISILDIPYSPVLRALARADLPSIRVVTISIYSDLESSDATAFLEAHAEKLTTLTLSTAQTWPATATLVLPNILVLCPNLRYLSLPTIPANLSPPDSPSPLRVLSIPRPTIEFLNRTVEPLLPSLREVRIRDQKYLRRSMGAGAASTGSSAIMLEWRRRLLRRRVIVYDALGRDGP